MGSLDNILAEVVEGNKGMKTEAFPGGISTAAVNGCWQCHGKWSIGKEDPKAKTDRQKRSLFKFLPAYPLIDKFSLLFESLF